MDNKYIQLCMRRWFGTALILTCPLCLLVGLTGNCWSNEYGSWNQTVSSLYWSSGRNIFVIGLGFGAIISLLYKGYDWRDKIVGWLNGLCLLGIIIFPSYNKAILNEEISTGLYEIIAHPNHVVVNWIHISLGLILFILPIINLLFIFTRSSGEKTKKKIIRNRIYITFGIIILCNLIVNTYSVATYMMQIKTFIPVQAGLYLETINLIIYGIGWLIKGGSIKILND